MEILTGPKGGKYYIDEKGRKRYLKRESSEMAQNSGRKRANETQKSKSQKVSETVYRKHTVTVADYEHSGDLDHEIAYIKSICPQARNFKAWEEEDYEAESEYEQDYGECDEPIYQGYVSFEAPKSWDKEASKYGIY